MAQQHNTNDNKRDSFLHRWLSGGGTVASSDGDDTTKDDRRRPSWMETFLGRSGFPGASTTSNKEEKDKLIQKLTSQLRKVPPEDLRTTKFSLTAHELMLLLDVPEAANVLPEEEPPHYCVHTRDRSTVSAWDFKSEGSLPPDEIEAIVLALEADAEEGEETMSAITGSSGKPIEIDGTKKLPMFARTVSIQRFKSVDSLEDQFLVTIGDAPDGEDTLPTTLEQIKERSEKAESRLQRRYSLAVKNSQDDDEVEKSGSPQEQNKRSQFKRRSTKLQASVRMLSRTRSDHSTAASVHQFIVSLPCTTTNMPLASSVASGSVPEKELHLSARRVSVKPMHLDPSLYSTSQASSIGMVIPAMEVFDLEDNNNNTHNTFRPTTVRMNGSAILHEFGVAGLG